MVERNQLPSGVRLNAKILRVTREQVSRDPQDYVFMTARLERGAAVFFRERTNPA
jgi:hypothetical protein